MMNRWWDDAAAAAQILSVVDDSDVIQGSGTAVLGYHALAKAALAPLAVSTLVDPADVVIALDGVDLGPVAKALGAATRPVMGEASGRYGQLLAQDLHDQAKSAASHMVSTLVAKSVPTPLAVGRVAEAVGLPLDRSGRFVEAMSKPAIPALVVSDAADRALMEFAAHLGRRESGAVEGLVGKAEAFQEAEHPRAQDGKFARKPDKSKRLERLKDRRERRENREAKFQREVAAEKAKQVSAARSLRDLATALRPEREVTSRQGREVEQKRGRAVAQKLGSLLQVKQDAVSEANQSAGVKATRTVESAIGRSTVRQAATTVPWLMGEAPGYSRENPKQVQLGVGREQIVLVPMEVAQNIFDARGFRVGRLEEQMGNELTTHRVDGNGAWREFMSSTRSWRKHHGGQPLLVAIRFSGTVMARDGGEEDPSGMQLASNSLFRALTDPFDTPEMYTVAYGPKIQDPETGESKPMNEHQFPIIDVYLDNEEEFFEKALETWTRDGVQVQVDVERDKDGEFARREAKRIPKGSMNTRQQRLKDRRARREGREARFKAFQATEQVEAATRAAAEQTSLKDLAARLVSAPKGKNVTQREGRTVVGRQGRQLPGKRTESNQLFIRPQNMDDGVKGLAVSDSYDGRAEDAFDRLGTVKAVRLDRHMRFGAEFAPVYFGVESKQENTYRHNTRFHNRKNEIGVEPEVRIDLWQEGRLNTRFISQTQREYLVEALEDYATFGNASYVEGRHYATAAEAHKAAQALNVEANGRSEGKMETYVAFEPSVLTEDLPWVVRTTAYADPPAFLIGEDSEFGDANEALDWAMSGLEVEFVSELVDLRTLEQQFGLASPDYQENIQLAETNPMVRIVRARIAMPQSEDSTR